MKAMILAAGLGERLRPLTETTPKPLIEVAGKPLIAHHLEKLAAAGIEDVIINISWLADRIRAELGDGSDYGIRIEYSEEQPEPLETAGGIRNARALLGDDPFLLVNGDIWCDIDFTPLIEFELISLAHLILVENPSHNPDGDFGLEDGLVSNTGDTMYTYAGIGLFDPTMFNDVPAEKTPLAPILREHCDIGEVTGELHEGLWTDVGDLERLEVLRASLES